MQSFNISGNGSTTDHLDDFVARIDKLRQVDVMSCMHRSVPVQQIQQQVFSHKSVQTC